MTRALVFTDLDGCLLDHHSYSFEAALPVLEQLRSMGVPVIPNSSKTGTEIRQLRDKLRNNDPFICENGAAVYIPVGYFAKMPTACVARNGFWVREFSAPRKDCLQLLASLRSQFAGDFIAFSECSVKEIQRLTELSARDAARALEREYSEPLKWQGDDNQKKQFIAQVEAAGFRAVQGGRFLTLSGGGDKGEALRWLRALFQQMWNEPDIHDLAVGDSPNDRPMLEASTHALVIRIPGKEQLQLNRDRETTIYSEQFGPQGWATGVTEWLQHIARNETEGNSHG